MQEKERNYGIDLLKIVLMYMICILHTLKKGGILDACTAGTWQYKVFWLLEVFAFCAVDGFALISGYIASEKPGKFEKLVEMWFQVFFYSFIITMIFTIIGINKNWQIIDIIKCILPVTFGKFWYFTAFFGLFFAIPVINKFLFSIDETIAKKSLIIIIILFSILGTLGDPFKLNNGYSTIWLIVLYCIGVLIKKIKLFETKKSITLILLWILCILSTWGIYVFLGNSKLINYISPTILFSAMIMVILFSRLKIKTTIISKIVPFVFGIYLFQVNQVVWNNIIKNAFGFVANKSILIGTSYVLGLAFIIFATGMIIEFIRNKIARIIKIPSLSKKIALIMDKIIEKFYIILK